LSETREPTADDSAALKPSPTKADAAPEAVPAAPAWRELLSFRGGEGEDGHIFMDLRPWGDRMLCATSRGIFELLQQKDDNRLQAHRDALAIERDRRRAAERLTWLILQRVGGTSFLHPNAGDAFIDGRSHVVKEKQSDGRIKLTALTDALPAAAPAEEPAV